MRYVVKAFQDGRTLCEVATIGVGLDPRGAELFAHELREEFPDAIVAILPAKSA
ncbi:hypothetical protein [Streptomyces sp. NPDC058664]|uniref:hypothetical protein n=1 Tax=unclassified Streptomyces TaxID=2593676 RepID=UPI00364C77D5